MTETECIQRWKNVNKAFENPIMNETIKYKRCGNHIIQMMRTDETKDNEKRFNVVDRRYAKFRANKLLVLKIYNEESNEFVASIEHFFYAPIKYMVGQVVIPDAFDDDIDRVCTNGIHYFTTLFAAFFYGYNNVIHIYECGQMIRFDDSHSKEQNTTWLKKEFDQLDVDCF